MLRAARRRCSSSIRPAICCGTGAGRARATSGPIRTTASSSTTRATSGSAATAARDSHILKFTKDGKFLMQVGKKGARRKAGAAAGDHEGDVAGLRRRQQRPGELRPRRQDLRRSEGERGLYRRRLSEQARRGARRRHRQDEALVGRLRQQAGRHAAAGLRSGRRRRRSSSATRCTAPTCRSIACCMSATASATGSRSSRPRASSSRKRSTRRTRKNAGLGVGHRVLERCAAALHLHGRRREREGQGHRPPDAAGADDVR